MSSKLASSRGRAALLILGGAFGAFGGWWANTEYTVLKTWATTDAQVVSARVVTRRDRKQNVLYAPEITLQYTVRGRRYVSSDRSVAATSFQSWPQHQVDANPPGAHRLIRYNPSDPAHMRFGMGYNFSTFGPPGIFLTIGLFLLVVFLNSFRAPAPAPTACPSCGAPLEFGRNTCPNCGASIPTNPGQSLG
jgi:Protein of unknown function (DUF3592)/zinc-ribbon domain